jgi:acetolactate synthase-1/2/3 large subunit
VKLADYVITYLRDAGITKVFQVYGAATGDLVDAFSRIKGIDYICPIHEQAASFMAETYTKVTGKISCAMATSGPGGINLLNGIANCYYDSIPCLFITGQINTQFIKKHPSIRQVGFQENDIVAMAKSITKYAKLVTDSSEIRYILDKAIHEATSGRPGPVLIDIPIDVQRVNVEPSQLRKFNPTPLKFDYAFIQGQIDELIRDLGKAKRPVLLVGGGVRLANAVEPLRLLADVLKMPCIPTWNATDIITSDYEYYGGRVGTYGGPGRNFAIQNADLLLTIGSRISGRITGGNVKSFARAAKKYIVDIDTWNLNPDLQEVEGDVNIYADAGIFIRLLLEKLRYTKLPDYSNWVTKTLNWVFKYPVLLPEYQNDKFVHPYVFIKALSEACGPDDIIVVDCGGNAVVTFQGFETKQGQRLISSNGNSPMGYSFAGAIGACFAEPDKRVICLIGDGGFQMNIQELQTIRHYGLKLKTFILNNHCYGITHQFQTTNYGSRFLASGPDGYSVPNFLEITAAYDIATYKINNHGNLDKEINQVLDFDGPIVCDVDIDHHAEYEPRISGWKTPIEDMHPYLSRKEFRENMIIKPLANWETYYEPERTGWGEERRVSGNIV